VTVVLAMLTLFLSVGLVLAQIAYRKRKLFRQSWDSILSRVESVDFEALREVADLYLQPGPEQLRIEPNDMWHAVGGLGGIERMRRNADVMLELAVYGERWNNENGRVISEMIRRDVMRFRKAAFRVEFSLRYRLGMVRAPFQLQEAISAYCLMRGRLIGLYKVAHVGLIPQIEAAL